MRYAVLAVAMGVAGIAQAQVRTETRTPTAAEQQSFEQFYRQAAPGAVPPPLHASRQRGARQWTLSAVVDSAPARDVLPLCRLARTRYTQAGGEWRSSSEQHVWVHHAPQCGPVPAHMLELRAPLAGIDILKLVQAEKVLLQRARLLMTGNTSCAPTRSRAFQLRVLDKTKQGLFLLGFESDIGTRVDVSVRQSRAELTAWNVSCY